MGNLKSVEAVGGNLCVAVADQARRRPPPSRRRGRAALCPLFARLSAIEQLELVARGRLNPCLRFFAALWVEIHLRAPDRGT